MLGAFIVVGVGLAFVLGGIVGVRLGWATADAADAPSTSTIPTITDKEAGTA